MRNYLWLGVTKDVGKYMKGCDACQRMKNRTEAPAEKLMMNEVLKEAWTYLMVDFITKYAIFDNLSHTTNIVSFSATNSNFVATIEGTLAEGLVRLFRDNV